MAKAKTTSASSFIKKPRKKRKGVHSKNNTSKLKGSKNYKKLNVGQGK
jgi:hypothetical protein